MKWTQASAFTSIGSDGSLAFKRGVPVPASCIHSAEYVLQCIANGKTHPWKEGEDVTTEVIAHFGGGKQINITTSDQVHYDAEGQAAYPFPKGFLPQVGQGLAYVWSAKGNPPGKDSYLMHFGTVIAAGQDDGNAPVVCITNLMEVPRKAIPLVDLDGSNTKILRSVADFAFSTDARYVLGLLQSA